MMATSGVGRLACNPLLKPGCVDDSELPHLPSCSASTGDHTSGQFLVPFLLSLRVLHEREGIRTILGMCRHRSGERQYLHQH